MVTYAQVQNGLGRYISDEFVSRLSGIQKWVVDGGAAMILANGAEVFERLKDNAYVQMMGIIDEHNNIDIDKAYAHFKAAAAKGPATFNLPLVGGVTLYESDIDKIYRCIIGG